MDRIYQKSYSLQALHALIERGIFAVPQLQREFVWNARKACQLLDSIFHGYPIGTILVWRTVHRNESQLRKSLHILPPYDPSNKEVYFLIDGQQRLSVLWHLLHGQLSSVTTSSGAKIDFSDIYFDLLADDDTLFVHRKRLTSELQNRLVPLVDLLSSRWRTRICGYQRARPRRVAQIADCRRRILTYHALFVFCETRELAEVRETFIRINSQGMKITSADRAFARASKLDLRGDVRDALLRLEHGFSGVSRQTVLQTIAFALGGKDLGERAIDSMVRKLERDDDHRSSYRKLWPMIRESLAHAADYFVHSLGVPSLDYLPSEPMMTTLAYYFFCNRNKRPPLRAQRTLKRWFWATAVGARYTGQGYRINLLADTSFMALLARSPARRPAFTLSVEKAILQRTEYGRPGPISNAFFILLRRHKPRYLADGTEIPLSDISSRANRRDMHHIFPRSILHGVGIQSGIYNSILNICYLAARENQSVGSNDPRSYLELVPRSRSVRDRAMRSHLIPLALVQDLTRQGLKACFKRFVIDRTRLLVKAFEEQAQMQIFAR